MDEIQRKLEGHLGLLSGMLLIVAVNLGSGILVIPGLVFEKLGNDAIFAWLACSVLSAPILVTMAILGSAYPSTGGAAYYANLAFGRYLESLVGLLVLGATALGLPALAIVGATNLKIATSSELDIHCLAVIVILLAAWFALSGSKTLSGSVRFVSGASISLLVGVLGVLLTLAVRTNGVRVEFPKNVLAIAGQIPLIFFSFAGWEIACNLSVDFRDPRRAFGLAMILAFILVCSVYLGSAALVHISGIKSNFDTPVLQAAVQVAPTAPDWLVPVLGTLVIVANLFGSVVAVSRLILYLSGQGILPAGLGYLRDGAPRNSVFLVMGCLITVVMADQLRLLRIETMFGMAGMNFLAIYIISAIALAKLRRGLVSWLLAGSIVVLSAPIMLNATSSLIYLASTALLASSANRNNRMRLL
ncbi:amino acid permease [Bradyrhizobium sp. 83012]|uniref:Amino acid permease n=1 Tax=Bradyrhizobium aeschynomenes TaxID=2734909 RepID=A0ABX2CNA6_9BRAD|nr:amino acid permease [Bradyrhizobium aeschynomenes]NPU15742.1 amino acid permease [Bradyrhizobium aeschynomenes]NPU69689.1 amino acid permease [Bradyrhizobium aeschynomenes]NPV24630.1 amino acid permease [Bradyrhizobium aeschynomenes]